MEQIDFAEMRLATTRFRTMELITILNRCHRFPGFLYQHARFSPDKKGIGLSVRPRKGSAAICSRCHEATPGYDQLAERRFEFIPLRFRGDGDDRGGVAQVANAGPVDLSVRP